MLLPLRSGLRQRPGKAAQGMCLSRSRGPNEKAAALLIDSLRVSLSFCPTHTRLFLVHMDVNCIFRDPVVDTIGDLCPPTILEVVPYQNSWPYLVKI